MGNEGIKRLRAGQEVLEGIGQIAEAIRDWLLLRGDSSLDVLLAMIQYGVQFELVSTNIKYVTVVKWNGGLLMISHHNDGSAKVWDNGQFTGIQYPKFNIHTLPLVSEDETRLAYGFEGDGSRSVVVLWQSESGPPQVVLSETYDYDAKEAFLKGMEVVRRKYKLPNPENPKDTKKWDEHIVPWTQYDEQSKAASLIFTHAGLKIMWINIHDRLYEVILGRA